MRLVTTIHSSRWQVSSTAGWYQSSSFFRDINGDGQGEPWMPQIIEREAWCGRDDATHWSTRAWFLGGDHCICLLLNTFVIRFHKS